MVIRLCRWGGIAFQVVYTRTMRPPIVVSNLEELREVVLLEINTQGPSADLNHIDVSSVDDFHSLFKGTEFCGNVSQWNMQKARSTSEMFMGTPFNGEISNWNMETVENASKMFAGSQFNGDLSKWNVARMIHLNLSNDMFKDTHFAQSLAAWNIAGTRETFQTEAIAALEACATLWPKLNKRKKDFTPPSTQPYRENILATYEKLFGGYDNLNVYLGKMPLNVMHFDISCAVQECPPGVAPKDFAWSKEIQSVGVALGLNNAELRDMFHRQLAFRGKEVVVESYSVDCMG